MYEEDGLVEVWQNSHQATSLKVRGWDFQLMIKEKIHKVRHEIRDLGFEQNRLNMIARKTTLILVSIERYSHERMMQAIVEFEITSKKIHEVNKKMKKKFDELYILNVEYMKPELVA